MNIYIDASFLAYRSQNNFHKAFGYQSKSGKRFSTGTLYSFLKDLLFLIKLYPDADNWGIVWDSKPTERIKIDQGYKAHRKKDKDSKGYKEYLEMKIQLKELLCLLPFTGINQYRAKGYEADDVLATLAERGTKEVLLVCRDKDLYQTISENVSLYDLWSIKDLKWFRGEHGIEPKQWIDVQTLVGDSTDNIQGIKGVGVKTAIKLLNKYGSFSKIVENEGFIRNSLEVIEKSRKLVTLRTDLNIEVINGSFNVLRLKKYLVKKKLWSIRQSVDMFEIF